MPRIRMFVLGGLLAGILGTTAVAQATLFDGAKLRSGCLGGQCETVIRAEVGRLQSNQIQGDAFNSQLGGMAALLFELAQQANPVATADITRGLMILAEFSSDAAQRSSLVQLASAIADGSADLFALGDPFAVSPN